MTNIEDKVKRPVKYLVAIAGRYPGLWKWVDRLRANRDKIARDWPTWCYLPMPGAGGIADVIARETKVSPHKMDAAFIATLASWRVAKDIYLYDETVFEELWSTPIEGKIPIEVLHRLPTFCAYVAFPKPRDIQGGDAYGFFVHLNHSTRSNLLMLVLDFGSVDRIGAEEIGLAPYVLDLRENTDLLECLTLMDAKIRSDHSKVQFSEKFLQALGGQEACEEAIKPKSVKQVLEPLLSLTIYLCSASAEIRAKDPLRGIRTAYSKKTKDGVRTFVPDQPNVWEVAYRIGATLRAAAAATITGHGDKGGTHASPRPHIRRAHWHSFWTGPKAAVGKPETARDVVVKWIPPIAVAMGQDGEIIPTVHRVTQ